MAKESTSSATIQKPSPGRIVLVKQKDGVLPLLVTHVHSDTCVSGVIFNAFPPKGVADPLTSIVCGDDVGQWGWPPRV